MRNGCSVRKKKRKEKSGAVQWEQRKEREKSQKKKKGGRKREENNVLVGKRRLDRGRKAGTKGPPEEFRMKYRAAKDNMEESPLSRYKSEAQNETTR